MNLKVEKDDVEIKITLEDLWNTGWMRIATITTKKYQQILTYHGICMIERYKKQLVKMYWGENPIVIQVEEDDTL